MSAIAVPHGPRIVRRTSDSGAVNSGNTGVTLTSDDTLLWAMAANDVWFFELYLLVSAANATMDFKIALSLPAAATAQWAPGSSITSALPAWWVLGTASSGTVIATEATTLSLGTLAGVIGMNFMGVVVNGANAGNAVIQWAQNTANASDLKLLTNSLLRVTRLA